jgi:hypothetical protein
MQTVLSKLTPEFSFAGFSFPKHVWTLDHMPVAKRLQRRAPVVCGAYYHCPTPNQNAGVGFYLDSDGQPFTRWVWCDEVVSLRHTGWFCDEYQGQKIRGIVVRLPHGRFLAGWSMGENMASSVDAEVYTCERDAAYAADGLAESAADAEREYQANELAQYYRDEDEQIDE